MWNDGVIEEYQKSIFSSVWLRYIIVSATGRQAPIQQAGRSPSRLEGSQASSWQTGELGSQQAGLSAIASSALLMIAVVPPHCLGYCYTTIRYGKIWGARGREQQSLEGEGTPETPMEAQLGRVSPTLQILILENFPTLSSLFLENVKR